MVDLQTNEEGAGGRPVGEEGMAQTRSEEKEEEVR